LGFTTNDPPAFEPVWAIDTDPFAVASYNANFGNHCVVGDVIDVTERGMNEIPPADVVIGGPPCQGFSLLNKNRESDPRKQLWRPFFKVLAHSGAGVFLMENVPQLIGSHEHELIVRTAEAMGFRTAWAKLCAADYGVPQTRIRAFILGSRIGEPALVFPPSRTHRPADVPLRSLLFADRQTHDFMDTSPYVTVRDAIGELPPPIGTEIRDEPPPLDLHFGRTPTELSVKRYKAIPEQGMNRFDLQRVAPEITPQCWIRKTKGGTDLFGRLWWDRPAFTIRTEFYKPEKGRYLHPEQHRPITHREAARLQSFPDSFKFVGPKIEIARQIGNAVPPLLAARLADCVLPLLESSNAVVRGKRRGNETR
jgi:DNA (cytosine-5)-methyltransferase 1